MLERRQTNNALEIRLRAGQEPVISGLAAVYFRDDNPGTEYQLWQGAVERIMPGAFDVANADDVVALFNHDPNQVLGRTPDTLKLSVDDAGLRYEVTPSDTSFAQDVVKMIKRGDVRGSSFAFEVIKDNWRIENDTAIREVRSVRLVDVSPVTRPAYGATSVGLRSESPYVEARHSYDTWQSRLQTELRRQRADELMRSLAG